MKFKVLKSSLDGISGSGGEMTLGEAIREISYYRGWPSLGELHNAIRKWGTGAKAGDIMTMQASAIVCVRDTRELGDEYECPECLSDEKSLSFSEFEVTEDGFVEQTVTCACGYRWKDIFTLTERRELSKRK